MGNACCGIPAEARAAAYVQAPKRLRASQNDVSVLISCAMVLMMLRSRGVSELEEASENGYTVAIITTKPAKGAAISQYPSEALQRVDYLLAPLHGLARDARYGQALCKHVFNQLEVLARAALGSDSGHLVPRLSQLQDLSWVVEEFLGNFTNRGWLLRLQYGEKVEAVYQAVLQDLGAAAKEWGLVLPDADPKPISSALRTVRRLHAVAQSHLHSLVAPHAGEADAAAFEGVSRRLLALLPVDGKGGRRGSTEEVELVVMAELQLAAAQLSLGAHSALRQPDLQLFWWQHLAGMEEVPWSTLWPHLQAFLATAPAATLSDKVGEVSNVLALLGQPDNLKHLQAVTHRMGYVNYATTIELDMAFPPHLVLEQQLSWLLQPRPALLARTSKGGLLAAPNAQQSSLLTGELSLLDATAAAAAAVVAASPSVKTLAEAYERAASAAASPAPAAPQASSSSAAAAAAQAEVDGRGSEQVVLGGSAAQGNLVTSMHPPPPRPPRFSAVAEAGADFFSSSAGGARLAGGASARSSTGGTGIPLVPRSAAGASLIGLDTDTDMDDYKSVRSEFSRASSSTLYTAGASSFSTVRHVNASAADASNNAIFRIALASADPSAVPSAAPSGPPSEAGGARSRRASGPALISHAGAGGANGGSGGGSLMGPPGGFGARGVNFASVPSSEAAAPVVPASARQRGGGDDDDGDGSDAAAPRRRGTIDGFLADDADASAGGAAPATSARGAAAAAASAAVAMPQGAPPPPPEAPESDSSVSELVFPDAPGAAAATPGPAARSAPPVASAGGASSARASTEGRDSDAVLAAAAAAAASPSGQQQRQQRQQQQELAVAASGGSSSAAATLMLVGRDAELQALTSHLLTAPQPVVLLVGPTGAGKSALATAASVRLARAGAWARQAYCDVRQAEDVDEVALGMLLALDAPFYAVDRPAAARLLSWLRIHGPGLGRLGLVIDNVGTLLLGAACGLQEDAPAAAEGAAAAAAASAAPAAQEQLDEAGLDGAGSEGDGEDSDSALASAAAAAEARARASQGASTSYGPSAVGTGAAGAASAGAGAGAVPLQRQGQLDEGARARLLRLLSEVQVWAPGLQIVLTAACEECESEEGQAALTGLESAAYDEQLPLVVQQVGPLAPEAAQQVLAAAARMPALMQEEFRPLVVACGCLPAVLRLAGSSIRTCAGDADMMLSSASVAIARAEDLGSPGLAVAGFCQHLAQHCVLVLPHAARSLLSVLCHLGQSLNEEECLAACGFMGHPLLVRSALCCLYDRGLISFQDLGQRHEVDSRVRGEFVTRISKLRLPSQSSAASAAAHPVEGHSVPAQQGGGLLGSGMTNTLDRDLHLKLKAFVEQLDLLLTQVGQLYGASMRLAALRKYNHTRGMVDRGLACLPQWLLALPLAGATAALFVGVVARHLNGVCRHVLTPSQLLRLTDRIKALSGQLPSHTERLAGQVAAARAYVHLRQLGQATEQVNGATETASSLFPALHGLAVMSVVGSTPAATPQPTPRKNVSPSDKRTGGGGEGAAAAATPSRPPLQASASKRAVSFRRLGSQASAAAAASSSGSALAGAMGAAVPIPPAASQALCEPLVSQLLLARAELSQASKKLSAAQLFLSCYVTCLEQSGRRHTLEFAQAKMRMGDLTLALHRPPAEAGRHYEDAATVFTVLHGHSHYRVGRAMLAAAKTKLPALGTSVTPASCKALDATLRDVMFIHMLSQGKFNLDMAEVGLSQSRLLLASGRSELALPAAAKALDIVVEILGDGTMQVAESLNLLASALRQLKDDESADALAAHAVAILAAATSQPPLSPLQSGLAQRPPTQALVLRLLGPRHPHAMGMPYLPQHEAHAAAQAQALRALPLQQPTPLTAMSAFAVADAAGGHAGAGGVGGAGQDQGFAPATDSSGGLAAEREFSLALPPDVSAYTSVGEAPRGRSAAPSPPSASASPTLGGADASPPLKAPIGPSAPPPTPGQGIFSSVAGAAVAATSAAAAAGAALYAAFTGSAGKSAPRTTSPGPSAAAPPSEIQPYDSTAAGADLEPMHGLVGAGLRAEADTPTHATRSLAAHLGGDDDVVVTPSTIGLPGLPMMGAAGGLHSPISPQRLNFDGAAATADAGVAGTDADADANSDGEGTVATSLTALSSELHRDSPSVEVPPNVRHFYAVKAATLGRSRTGSPVLRSSTPLSTTGSPAVPASAIAAALSSDPAFAGRSGGSDVEAGSMGAGAYRALESVAEVQPQATSGAASAGAAAEVAVASASEPEEAQPEGEEAQPRGHEEASTPHSTADDEGPEPTPALSEDRGPQPEAATAAGAVAVGAAADSAADAAGGREAWAPAKSLSSPPPMQAEDSDLDEAERASRASSLQRPTPPGAPMDLGKASAARRSADAARSESTLVADTPLASSAAPARDVASSAVAATAAAAGSVQLDAEPQASIRTAPETAPEPMASASRRATDSAPEPYRSPMSDMEAKAAAFAARLAAAMDGDQYDKEEQGRREAAQVQQAEREQRWGWSASEGGAARTSAAASSAAVQGAASSAAAQGAMEDRPTSAAVLEPDVPQQASSPSPGGLAAAGGVVAAGAAAAALAASAARHPDQLQPEASEPALDPSQISSPDRTPRDGDADTADTADSWRASLRGGIAAGAGGVTDGGAVDGEAAEEAAPLLAAIGPPSDVLIASGAEGIAAAATVAAAATASSSDAAVWGAAAPAASSAAVGGVAGERGLLSDDAAASTAASASAAAALAPTAESPVDGAEADATAAAVATAAIAAVVSRSSAAHDDAATDALAVAADSRATEADTRAASAPDAGELSSSSSPNRTPRGGDIDAAAGSDAQLWSSAAPLAAEETAPLLASVGTSSDAAAEAAAPTLAAAADAAATAEAAADAAADAGAGSLREPLAAAADAAGMGVGAVASISSAATAPPDPISDTEDGGNDGASHSSAGAEGKAGAVGWSSGGAGPEGLGQEDESQPLLSQLQPAEELQRQQTEVAAQEAEAEGADAAGDEEAEGEEEEGESAESSGPLPPKGAATAVPAGLAAAVAAWHTPSASGADGVGTADEGDDAASSEGEGAAGSSEYASVTGALVAPAGAVHAGDAETAAGAAAASTHAASVDAAFDALAAAGSAAAVGSAAAAGAGSRSTADGGTAAAREHADASGNDSDDADEFQDALLLQDESSELMASIATPFAAIAQSAEEQLPLLAGGSSDHVEEGSPLLGDGGAHGSSDAQVGGYRAFHAEPLQGMGTSASAGGYGQMSDEALAAAAAEAAALMASGVPSIASRQRSDAAHLADTAGAANLDEGPPTPAAAEASSALAAEASAAAAATAAALQAHRGASAFAPMEASGLASSEAVAPATDLPSQSQQSQSQQSQSQQSSHARPPRSQLPLHPAPSPSASSAPRPAVRPATSRLPHPPSRALSGITTSGFSTLSSTASYTQDGQQYPHAQGAATGASEAGTPPATGRTKSATAVALGSLSTLKAWVSRLPRPPAPPGRPPAAAVATRSFQKSISRNRGNSHIPSGQDPNSYADSPKGSLGLPQTSAEALMVLNMRGLGEGVRITNPLFSPPKSGAAYSSDSGDEGARLRRHQHTGTDANGAAGDAIDTADSGTARTLQL